MRWNRGSPLVDRLLPEIGRPLLPLRSEGGEDVFEVPLRVVLRAHGSCELDGTDAPAPWLKPADLAHLTALAELASPARLPSGAMTKASP
jgi:hypothetical protein